MTNPRTTTAAGSNAGRKAEAPRIRSVTVLYNGRSAMFDRFIDSLIEEYLARTAMCIPEAYMTEETETELLASA